MTRQEAQELLTAPKSLKQIRQTLGSRTVRQVAGKDLQRRLRATLETLEREIEEIAQKAEWDDPVSRIARGEGTEEDLRQVVLFET